MPCPVHSWFHDAVSALVYSLAHRHAEAKRPEFQPPYNEITQFVLRQHSEMTDYLRLPMLAATLGFDLLGLLRHQKCFHCQQPLDRWRQIRAWKDSKLGFKRDFIRFYESLMTLALHGRLGYAGKPEETDDRAMVHTSDDLASQVIFRPASELRCEVAVIGSGPGGAITACLLAEAGRDVLLIEEGPFHPLESCMPFSLDEMRQKYRNGGLTVAMGKTRIAYVEGCCVGGGSEINSGLYHRTPPDMLELWCREFQVAALSENDLQPHFEAIEKDLSVSLLPGIAPAASLKLHEGAARLGWRSMEVPRWFRYDAERSAGGAAKGTRQSMTKTFVPRFVKAGGRLLPEACVERIRQDGAKWTLRAGHAVAGALRVEAETVFVCGGAVQTPALLRRSGITRNIGNALRLHPTLKVVARFPETVNSADMGVPAHQVKEFAPRISFGCSISTPPYLALGLIDHAAEAGTVPDAWQGMANYYAMITGEGYGRVCLVPGFRDPVVRYNLTANDRRDLAEGLRKLAELLFAAGAAAIYPSIAQSPALRSGDDLARLPARLPVGLTNLMTIHLFSSCPMGEERTKCATDSFGRVHGFANLFIADASLLCTAPGVNPQGSIMALARRNALQFLSKR